VEVEKHYYSVPHQLLREKLWARITTRTVELFHNGKRIAAHLRSSSDRKHTTVREHMPSSHQRYADWTPERLKRQAGEIGRNTATLVELVLTEKTTPSRASAPASASCGWPRVTGLSGLRPPAPGRLRSAPAPTPPSARS
jgi:transposase